MEQLLRQKREELVKRWEDREKRLQGVRLKEKALEDRARKRRRLEDHGSSSAAGGNGRRMQVDDEDAEWLVSDPSDRDAGQGDALSGLSKESRDILTKIGLGGHRGPGAKEDEDDMREEGVKVRGPLLLYEGDGEVVTCFICRSTIPREHTLNCLNSLLSSVVRPFHLHSPRP